MSAVSSVDLGNAVTVICSFRAEVKWKFLSVSRGSDPSKYVFTHSAYMHQSWQFQKHICTKSVIYIQIYIYIYI